MTPIAQILASTTWVRFGVARNVAVAVWWWNSLVTISTPRIIMSSSPTYWPPV